MVPTQTTGKMHSVGLRHTRIYELLASGYPGNATTSGSTAYQGIQLTSSESCMITYPEPRIIEYPGDDRLQQRDILAPLTGAKMVATVNQSNYPLYAIMTNTNVLNRGYHSFIGVDTNKLGYNPQVGLMGFQVSKDHDSGLQQWRAFIASRAIAYPMLGQYEGNIAKMTIPLTPMISNVALWGETYTNAVHGFTSAEMLEGNFNTEPWLISWVTSSGSTTSFVFDTNYPAASGSQIDVYVNGTYMSGSSIASASTTGFTLAVGVPANTNVVALYELGATINV